MTSNAREDLLKRLVGAALKDGTTGLSLRELAATADTSHRMLIYHFGSREHLLVAVAEEVERLQRESLPRSLDADEASKLWARLIAPEMRNQERLFFEVYIHALKNETDFGDFLDGVVENWVAPVSSQLTQAGVAELEARAIARLGVAVTRGLLLDLLATNDTDGVTAAHNLFLGLLQAASRRGANSENRN